MRKRQASERVKLEESYRIENERFDVEWAQKMKDVEERCRLKLVELAELHEIARDNLEREIAHKVKGMRYKNSSYLLGLEDVERRLALSPSLILSLKVGLPQHTTCVDADVR